MSIDAQRGERLRQERDRLSLSQQSVADAVEVRREMWSKYESGAEPGATVLSRAAQLGVDVLYVLTGTRAGPYMPPIQAEVFQAAISAMDRAIERKHVRLDAQKRAGLYLALYETALATGSVTDAGADVWLRVVLDRGPAAPAESPAVLHTYHGDVGTVHAVHSGSINNTYENAASKTRQPARKRKSNPP